MFFLEISRGVGFVFVFFYGAFDIREFLGRGVLVVEVIEMFFLSLYAEFGGFFFIFEIGW